MAPPGRISAAAADGARRYTVTTLQGSPHGVPRRRTASARVVLSGRQIEVVTWPAFGSSIPSDLPVPSASAAVGWGSDGSLFVTGKAADQRTLPPGTEPRRDLVLERPPPGGTAFVRVATLPNGCWTDVAR